MGNYKIQPLPSFSEMLARLEAKHPQLRELVSVATKYLESKANLCGISTNRDQKYLITRSTPSFVLFFHVNEEQRTVNLTTIGESPKGAAGEADEDESKS
jgi:mRNA-degrading endonuclease RelE of RelBE toxin-antitoxin system